MKGRNIGRILIPISLSVLLSGFTVSNLKIAAVNDSNINKSQQVKRPVYSMYINDQKIGLVEFPAHSLRVYD